jgi:hypothetical protein
MLKFSGQTFYQPLFSIFPSAIVPSSLWHFPSMILFPSAIFSFSIFPSTILFHSKSFLHQKAQSKTPKGKSQKAKAKAPLPLSGVFYSSKQGGAKGRGVTL